MEPCIQNYRLPWAIIPYGTMHSELQASLDIHSLWNHAFRITGFLGQSFLMEPCIQNYRLPWAISKQTQPDVWNMKDDLTTYVFHIRRPGFMIIISYRSPFSIDFDDQMFSNCDSTTDTGIVKLYSDCFCGIKVNIDEY
jgi:hypothetical protein